MFVFYFDFSFSILIKKEKDATRWDRESPDQYSLILVARKNTNIKTTFANALGDNTDHKFISP